MSAEKSNGAAAVDAAPEAVSPASPKSTPEEAAPAADEAVAAWNKNERGVKWWLLVLCVLCCTLLYSLDNSILADVAPVCVHEQTLVGWIVDGLR